MTVKKNDRRTASSEYENTYIKLYRYLENRIQRMPKRYIRYLGEKMYDSMNIIRENIAGMTILFQKGKPRSIDRLRKGIVVLEEFENLIDYSYTFWNLSCDRKNKVNHVRPKSRIYWTRFINHSIALIDGVMKNCNGYQKANIKVPFMQYDFLKESDQPEYMKQIMKIQRTIFHIAIRTHASANMDLLVNLSIKALANAEKYKAIKDNNTISTKDKKKLIASIYDCIQPMQHPFAEVVMQNDLPELTIKKFANTLCDIKKLLDTERRENIKS